MYNIGFIGFGEAAHLIASGIKSELEMDIYAYDVNQFDEDLGANIVERAKEIDVYLVKDIKELTQKCKIVFSATSAKVSFKVAENTLPYLTEDHYYIDINASSPTVMEEVGHIFKDKSNFIDGAVVESIPKYQHKVPILISGTNGRELEEILNSQLQMNISFIDEEYGSASAIKMIRSIFMKGFTMLMIETFSASEKYGIDEWIMESIENSIMENSLAETIDLLIPRTVPHAERRVSEMAEVIKTLESIGIDYTMSNASKKKLESLVKMKEDEKLRGPFQDYKGVIKAINDF